MKILLKISAIVCALLLLLFLLPMSGIEKKSPFVSWSVAPNHSCDGETLSVTIEKKDEILARDVFNWESASRTVSKKVDSWRVNWRIADLTEGATNYPSNITYLGCYEAQYDKDNTAVKESGQRPGTQPHPEYRGPDSEAYRAFLKATGGLTPFFRTLTEDQRYLVFVPYFGGRPGVKQGFDHDRAFCYDLVNDKFFVKTIALPPGPTAILYAESAAGELQFIASADQKKTAVMNADSEVISEISGERMPFFSFGSHSYWSPQKKLLIVSESKIDSEEQKQVTLREYYYGKNSTRTFNLNAGVMPLPGDNGRVR